MLVSTARPTNVSEAVERPTPGPDPEGVFAGEQALKGGHIAGRGVQERRFGGGPGSS